jgi:hypothetical protein
MHPALVLSACAALWLAAGARAGAPDWSNVAAVEEIEAITADADGSPRETTVWLAVVDGQGYVRTSGSSTWGDNLERDPELVVRIDGAEYPVRAIFIEDDALRGRVIETFRAKYGFSDALVDVFRGSRPRIMRLDPRDPGAATP